MKLNSIKIKNIRSIKNLELTFPPSTVLFYGDIGSGKSSVLKAIEFALFGILTAADLKGNSLLRRGENKASVELEFTINGAHFNIIRGLSRSKKGEISQTKGSLTIDGNEISYSPTELKRKILDLLKYSITRYENAKEIPIFRYTVYTPQETVKEILQANPEDRFEILKDVFGIEKYEVALRNIEAIDSYMHDKIIDSQGKLRQIGNPEEQISQKEKDLNQKTVIIEELKTHIEEKAQEILKIKTNLQTTEKELEDYSQRLVEIQKIEYSINEAKKIKEERERSLRSTQQEILNSQQELDKISEILIDFKESREQLVEKIRSTRNDITEKKKQEAINTKAINDVKKLLKEGKCSLCGQEIHEKDRFESELKETNQAIILINTEIDNLNREIENLEAKIKRLSEYSQNKSRREMYERLKTAGEKRLRELKEEIKQKEEIIDQNQKQVIKILKVYDIKNLEGFKKLEKGNKDKLIEIKKELDNRQSAENELRVKFSAENTALQYLKKELNQLKKAVELKVSLNQKIEIFASLRDWVKNEFPVLIRDIEREILLSSASQFNEYFKEWFHLLVEEQNIEVEIRPDDFEPVIMVNGYESPFNDMSGGEKSAISLAYRLALNKIINERYQEVKTKDLLILDEPTDGFSQEQIKKMQDLFDSLNTEQLIIISHDSALYSCVTDIYNFKKENHITKVKKE